MNGSIIIIRFRKKVTDPFVLNLFQGQATDIQIQAEEIIKLKKQLNLLYVKHTGQPIETIGRL